MMMRYSARLILVVSLALLFLAGCGAYTIDYSNIKADLQYYGERSVAIGVLDARPFVVNGEKDPSYVGLMRGGYGNPFNLWTTSGKHLKDEMAETIVKSLRDRGFKITMVKTQVGSDASGLLSSLEQAGAERTVILEVKDWWNNYYPASFGPEKTELVLNVEMKVYDQKKKILGSSRIEGVDNPPPGWPKNTIPGFYQKKMAELMNHVSVYNALK